MISNNPFFIFHCRHPSRGHHRVVDYSADYSAAPVVFKKWTCEIWGFDVLYGELFKY